jgi:pyridoxine kinase
MDKRLLTIQDISCVGQCSLTVALPVISACGIETAILPSSVLSNHTAFKTWTFNDLTFDMENILAKWNEQKISFSAFYTGYVSAQQIPVIKKIIRETSRENSLVIVDPVMADNGKLYPGFAEDFPEKMKVLCDGADVILPNITEACFLLGEKFPGENYDENFVRDVCVRLSELGAKNVVLTGVSFEKEKLGAAVYDGKSTEYYFTERLPVQMHGTGDVFASAFAGALCNGKSILESASMAADFVVESIRATLGDAEHWYGVKFEKAIPFLVKRIFSD